MNDESTPTAPTRFPSACPHDCPSTCALEVEVIDEHTIGKVYGAKSNDYTAGVICAKVSRYSERVHHPERLGVPLRRTGDKGKGLDAFEPLAWDDALDIVAENMLGVISRHGAEAIWPYHFAGTMGLIQRDGLDRFRNVLGTSRQHATFCTTLPDAGWKVGVGSKRGVDAREMIHSDLIVVWGGNPVNTQVNVMHHVAKARRENGAKFVVVDAYKTGTAKKADLHLMVKPGTDGALACAVMHVLFKEGFADREYLQKHTDFTPEFEQHLHSRTPEWASAITGISVSDIVKFARLYGKAKKSYIRAGYGFCRSRNGAVNMHAVSCLPSITGTWQHVGGGALYGNSELYSVDETLIKGLDQFKPDTRIMDQSRIGEVLCGNPLDLQNGPPVESIFIQNTNPVVVAPDTNRVIEGFSRNDLFTCVHEQFMTETAAMADIVLPATTFLEHDDMYKASGHTYLQVTRKLITPFKETRSNHWVLSALAKRLGISHKGFDLSEWELMDWSLTSAGFPGADEIADNRWHDCAVPMETAHFLDGFDTPDKLFHFKPDWSRVGPYSEGMPGYPDQWDAIDLASDAYPYRLVAAPARQFLNTTFTETASARRMEKKPTAKMHPSDCAALALRDGDSVKLSNDLGEIQIPVECFEGLQPGTVVVESIWPNSDFEGGTGINTLISSSPGQPNGGAVFHDTAIAVTKE